MKKESSKNDSDPHGSKIKKYIDSLRKIEMDQFKIVQEGIQGMNQRLDRIENRLGRVENKLDTKVDRYEFVALEKRVGVGEKG